MLPFNHQIMNSFEIFTERLDKHAANIVKRAMDELQPGIERSPQQVENTRRAIMAATRNAVSGEANPEKSISNQALTAEFRNSRVADEVVADYLTGIAQSIDALTKPPRYEQL